MSTSQAKAVGIDLGTTHSVIAYLDKTGRPTTIRNSEGDATTQSVVLFDKLGPVVGKEATRIAPHEMGRIAQFVKRDMGDKVYDKSICGTRLPPEVVQAVILKKLKDDGELVLGEINDVVVTVPAYFNEPRRKATQDAGRLAGLNVLDIINEPTAAAIAYGVQQGFLSKDGEAIERQRVLVYDLGGGTFDATLMDIATGEYDTMATAGDVYLGGIDWDQRIVDYMADWFAKENGIDPREDESAVERLRQEAEVAKMALTARSDYNLHFEFQKKRLRVNLTRETFESLTRDLVERTLFTIRKLLKEGAVKWSELNRLILVGGSSRMPMIQEALEAESGMKVDRSISPDEAVAHGAAFYAGFLLGTDETQRDRVMVKNVNSHDLGVLGIEASTGLPRRRVLIARNTRLPAEGYSRFSTQRDNQSKVVVNVIEGGDASGKNATPIGTCEVSDLPPNLSAKTRIDVRFKYEENGRLQVKAWLPEAKREAKLTIQRASGLADRVIDEWKELIQAGLILTGDSADSDEDFESVLEDDLVLDLNASENSAVFDEEVRQQVAAERTNSEAVEVPPDEASDEALTERAEQPADQEADQELDDFLKGLP